MPRRRTAFYVLIIQASPALIIDLAGLSFVTITIFKILPDALLDREDEIKIADPRMRNRRCTGVSQYLEKLDPINISIGNSRI